MSTKQIKITYHVQNLGGNLNNVTIQLGTTTLFSGSLTETGPVFQSAPPQESTGEITVDYDIVDWNNDEPCITTPKSITVTGGKFMIDDILANYNIQSTNTGTAEAPVWQFQAGTAAEFEGLSIESQPLWNGIADLVRYSQALNQENNTGPGQVLTNNGETVTFDIDVTKFNNHYPL